MRAGAVLAGVVVLCLAAAGLVSAQVSPPTVTVTSTATGITVSPGGPLAAGQTRFEFVRPGGGDAEIFVAALRAGVTLDQFVATLRADREGGRAIELVHLDGGANLSDEQPRRAATFNVRPNTTYVVADIAGENPQNWRFTTFTVGAAPNGAARPRADASVRMVDNRFRGDRTLPRNGTIRFTNEGWAPHFAFAARLRPARRRPPSGARCGRATSVPWSAWPTSASPTAADAGHPRCRCRERGAVPAPRALRPRLLLRRPRTAGHVPRRARPLARRRLAGRPLETVGAGQAHCSP